ncbi:MAG: hypothetical protein MJ200_03490 [Mycoplasmoidaceae bacterium]|nr:hypothetical protein [Mycoplasmoidaceae bacterium]
MNKKKTIVGICLNSLIVIGTIIALGLATIDVKTMKTTYGMLFKYFTTLSNLFLFVAAIL